MLDPRLKRAKQPNGKDESVKINPGLTEITLPLQSLTLTRTEEKSSSCFACAVHFNHLGFPNPAARGQASIEDHARGQKMVLRICTYQLILI